MEAKSVVDTLFKRLDAAWFRCFGVPEPEDAAKNWNAWLERTRGADAVFAELLRRVVGVTDGAARDYVKGRTDMLGDTTLAAMDAIAEAVGLPKPPRVETKTGRRITRQGVVLLAHLEGVPSPRFHLEAANCLVNAGARRGFPVSLHVPSNDAVCSARQISRLLRILNPRAVIWLRQAPRPEELESFARVQELPVVVLHGNPVAHAFPVIGNVIPDHDGVPRMVSSWASRLSAAADRRVPIVAMAPETDGPSLRGERIDAVRGGLVAAGFQPEVVVVPDYAAANGAQVLDHWPAAPGYACLSDAIAVNVAQLLAARGQPSIGRVLGFDDSALARRHGVTSINQHLPNAAERVFELLDSFFKKGQRDFSVARVPLTLSLRPEL